MSAPAAAGDPDAEIERLLEFLYICPVGLAELEPSGAVGMVNPLAVQLLIPIAPGGQLTNIFDALAPFAPDLRSLAASFEAPRGTVFENRRIHLGSPDGGEAAVILGSTLIKVDATRFMLVLTDASEQVAQERRLKQAESWFSIVLSGVNDFALLSLDKTGRISSWNLSGERQTGYDRADMLGRTMNVFYLPDEAVQGRALQQIEMARRDGWHIDEGWRRRKDGSRYWCQSLVSALEEITGEVSGFSVVMRDVTERKRDGDEIRRLLTTDHLTGVLNRARFYELAETELARCRRFTQPMSALMIDIDHFKAVNDRHGHAGGDEVLKVMAQAIQALVRSIDIFGRLGGEEFAILLPTVDLEGARIVAERLRREAAQLGLRHEGVEIPITVSIGCAMLASHEGGSVQTLLRAADEALYRAKREGRDRVVASLPAEAA